jgi:hypothetical protein
MNQPGYYWKKWAFERKGLVRAQAGLNAKTAKGAKLPGGVRPCEEGIHPKKLSS